MSIKVIVVDDSRTVRQQVGVVLQEAGFEVVEAVDGVEGLQRVAEHPDARVVLCDVNMPRMNGIDLLITVRAQGMARTPRFLMLTTESQPELMVQAKAQGASGWIIKPFKPDLLVAAVRKLAG